MATEIPDRCIHCGIAIEAAPRICPNCKKSQTKWAANLAVLAGSAGLLGVIAAAATFLLDWLPAYAKSFGTGELTEISLSFSSDHALYGTFANEGLNTLTIGEIAVFVPSRKSAERGFQSVVGETIPTKGVVEFSSPGDFGKDEPIVSAGDPNARFSTKLTVAHLKWSNCFRMIVRSESKRLLEQSLEDAGTFDFSAPHETYVRYFSSTRGKWKTKKIATRTSFRRSSKPECVNASILEEDVQ